jgi:hypothetical protein
MGEIPDRYKWIALSNATLAVLFSTLDGSITLIAMPALPATSHVDQGAGDSLTAAVVARPRLPPTPILSAMTPVRCD